ncbi:hypothetical protein KGF57_005230 [Candida theae]|uniref:Uncharacterized protein n=1 Tax=Candida theae TaxID=1198502 RepID=A0AAD5B9I3_9ASCO|nr:uncharacterized protein KGF57_005230 [Candida theae]KAI5948832.1 hypothetical protein KGF57_005230 [Candida theae]
MKNLNLHLKLNKMDFHQSSSISTPSGLNSQPYTPIDQTLKTPIQAPGEYPFNPPPLHHQNSYNSQHNPQPQSHPQPQPQPQQQSQASFYQNSQCAESDDILTDIDEPETLGNNNGTTNNTNTSSYSNASLKRPQFPMSNGMKNTSISNLSLNEMNLMHYNAQQSSQQAQAQGQGQGQSQNQPSNASIRSRSSSLNLRKQSLTRNNSNNWLHVGNIHSLRPRNSNASTDSLDCVPIQANIFNYGGGEGSSTNSTPPHSAGIQPHPQSNYFPQQPLSAGGNIQPQTAYYPPPPSSAHAQQDYPHMTPTSAPFNLPPVPPPPPFLQRSRSSTSGSTYGGAGGGGGPPSVPYHLNTESANAQALNSLNGRSSFNANANPAGFTLDSPFEPNSHPFSQPSPQQWSSQPCSQQYSMSQQQHQHQQQQQYQQYQQQRSSSFSSQSSQSSMLDDTATDEARFNSNFNTNYVSLSEKKRDSLKLKRGMH